MLIFAPHVVQTFPEPATRSDLMANFVKGYLGKKYGVPPPTTLHFLRRIVRLSREAGTASGEMMSAMRFVHTEIGSNTV